MATLDHSRRPMYSSGARYMSAWCPQLRTKAWLAFHGLPLHLRTKATCESAVADFGGLVRFAVPPSDGDGRVVLEARITRIEDVPRQIVARQLVVVHIGHLLTWPVDVEILAYAPVEDGDETAPPGALVMWSCNPEEGVDEDMEVGKPKMLTLTDPEPEERPGIWDGDGEASGAVERPESSICQAFTD